MNQQQIEKLDLQTDGSLDVHSIFYTVQGEGPHTGKPAVFVRLAGCNLQCPGCDTDYTSTSAKRLVRELLSEVLELIELECPEAPKPLIVITGGEPFRQNITVFANICVTYGFRVQVETNGTLPPAANLNEDVEIVVSPKTGKINKELEPRITALKYVVKAGCIDRKDGLPIRALDHPCSPVVAKPPEGYEGPVYLQPFDDGTIRGQRENAVAALNAAKRFGHIVQLQIHKILRVD